MLLPSSVAIRTSPLQCEAPRGLSKLVQHLLITVAASSTDSSLYATTHRTYRSEVGCDGSGFGGALARPTGKSGVQRAILAAISAPPTLAAGGPDPDTRFGRAILLTIA